MTQEKHKETIFNILNSFNSIESLKELFWKELNYERINEPLSSRGWPDSARKLLADDPLLFASGGNDSAFHIIYVHMESERLLLGPERLIVNRLLKEHPYALFAVSNVSQDRWHFINVKYDEEEKKRRLFRRITIGPEERLRTACERITLLDLESISGDLFGISPLDIQKQHDMAFDVEAVTKEFFKEYQTVFNILKEDLERQSKDRKWAHDYALQFLNRCMFLYFIQRKGWLGEDREFLRTFWETYNDTSQPPDTFVEKWVKVMFFEAFNGRPIGAHRHFPDRIKTILSLAPYLNGGLFTENELDRKYSFLITDNRFEQIFKFLERYNFTITEDSPLDQEVAVDPEMIGKVYESLVNVSEETSERGDAGIFYTPRIEITLMCRLALVDYLTNHLGEEYKSLLYELVFAIEQEDKEVADRKCTDARLWERLYRLLNEITVLDPACGSGSFLVGMLYILDDLIDRSERNLPLLFKEDAYNRKKDIIGKSLYGVDVMDWACHVAELRLWLALIADAEIDINDLHLRKEPLLPHFSFKIRQGDSLVQEIGGINFAHTRYSEKIPWSLKRRITELKNEKLKFYNNDPQRKFKKIEELKHEELRLFRDILDERVHVVKNEINEHNSWIKKQNYKMLNGMSLLYAKDGKPPDVEREIILRQNQIDKLQVEIEEIEDARSAIVTVKDIPFVWDIAFVEIFEGDKRGFDIVIGNPPYVRQENITDPSIPKEKVTTENKKAYKEKLCRSVYHAFPNFFGWNRQKGRSARKLDAKSDLYVYFYFIGLSLLNHKGSLCFITSNSWLDVGYGKDLQEFLLKHSHIKMIIDNQVKRSFASADVNTIITLFSAPDDRKPWALDKLSRFVMFKVPFEHVLSPVIFEEIEEAKEKIQTKEYRLFPVRQEELLKDGCEVPEEEQYAMHDNRYMEFEQMGDVEREDIVREKQSAGILIKSIKYIGNKWGGKYLRAPDIYWTILKKGKGKLVRLGDIAEVRRGFTTGANEFFYLDEEKISKWGIEEEFLRPVIKSPRECKRILIDPRDLKYKIFMCHKEKKDLKGTAALEYIKWGESQGFHERPSCRGRARWWDVGERQIPKLSFNYLVSSTAKTLFSFNGCYVSDNFQEVHTDKKFDLSLCAILNSTAFQLFVNMMGRSNFGGGLLKIQTYEVSDLICVDPLFISFEDTQLFESTSWEVIVPSADRKTLDSIIFDALDLTQTERDAVYEAVINLVESRLKKADSV